MSLTLRLGAIALLMTVFLTSMLVTHAQRRAGGTEIVLDVVGYDPRDPLLGHYSRIRVDIATLDALTLDGEDDFAARDTIYVTLAVQADGSWSARAISHDRPPDGIFLRGLVTNAWQSEYEWVETTDPATGEVTTEHVEHQRAMIMVDYKLNRYYASRATARALDDLLRDESQETRLIIAVQSNGEAVIKGLEIAGTRQLERLW